MARDRILQIYRGTTAQNDAFTGAQGELTMDTTTNELRVHDGITPGGHKIGGGYHPDLFTCQWTDHELNDTQWLHADTFSWQSGAVYQAAYQHLIDDITGKTLQSETIGGTTIQFYLADDGHKICPATYEGNVRAVYEATGAAWYYVIDTTNQRFKLPRTKFGFTGIRSGVGAFIEAELPNIRGQFSTGSIYGSVIANGAFTEEQQAGNGRGGSGNNEHLYSFSASSSSSVYKDGATVQPKATEMYLYFYVGNFTQTALENTAGLNAELFNGKADLNLANVLANIDFVVERQEPTAENNYTWYRKYRSGWVEQGGANFVGNNTVTLPVAMANTGYTLMCALSHQDNSSLSITSYSKTTTSFYCRTTYQNAAYNYLFSWTVSGMAAN